jgi:hypothetical protein
MGFVLSIFCHIFQHAFWKNKDHKLSWHYVLWRIICCQTTQRMGREELESDIRFVCKPRNIIFRVKEESVLAKLNKGVGANVHRQPQNWVSSCVNIWRYLLWPRDVGMILPVVVRRTLGYSAKMRHERHTPLWHGGFIKVPVCCRLPSAVTMPIWFRTPERLPAKRSSTKKIMLLET